MTDDVVFEDINEAKANLDDIYDRPDPRAYFHTLARLRYAIPGVAKPVFERLIEHLQCRRNHAIHVLDLGCSYGINAALLKYDLSIAELYELWGQERRADVATETVMAQDRRYFADLPQPEDIEVIGLDQAGNAIEYATGVGLLDDGFAVNLETDPLPGPAQKELAAIDLVASTGCVGYVTEKTFKRLLPAVSQGRPPWMANFVLRMFPFEPIEEALSDCSSVCSRP